MIPGPFQALIDNPIQSLMINSQLCYQKGEDFSIL
uniref:Uncharacterized protein n=1 Tax=Rhizophora mucronata TaxID=61149 RepID=A0A2P2PW24_RHIMU